MLRVRHMKVKLTMAHTKFYFFIRNAFDLWSHSPLFTLRPRLSSDSRGSERSEALTSFIYNKNRWFDISAHAKREKTDILI